MSPNDFSAPVYDEATQTDNPNTAGLDTPVHGEEIDLNDPRLASENIEVNPEGDAYATPPPPPDGEYRAKLKQIDVKDARGQQVRFKAMKIKGTEKLYLATAIEARIQDPAGTYDNIPVFDRWVGTFPNRDGSTKITTILTKLGVSFPKSATHKDLMEIFLKALAGEPDVMIETQWEASCQKCQEEAEKTGSQKPRSIRGMSRFPQDTKGKAIPEIACTVDKSHGVMVAQVRIVGFKPVKK